MPPKAYCSCDEFIQNPFRPWICSHCQRPKAGYVANHANQHISSDFELGTSENSRPSVNTQPKKGGSDKRPFQLKRGDSSDKQNHLPSKIGSAQESLTATPKTNQAGDSLRNKHNIPPLEKKQSDQDPSTANGHNLFLSQQVDTLPTEDSSACQDQNSSKLTFDYVTNKIKERPSKRKTHFLESITLIGKDPFSAIHESISKGAIEQVDKLYQAIRSRDLLNITTEYNKHTPLHIAVINHQVQSINYLIAKKVDLFKPDRLKRIPFHYACQDGALEIVQILYAADAAQIKAQDDYQNLGIHLAASRGRLEVVRFLLSKAPTQLHLENINKETPLHRAAHYNSGPVCHFLVDKGASLIKEGSAGIPYECLPFDGSPELKSLLRPAELPTKKSPYQTPRDFRATDTMTIYKTIEKIMTSGDHDDDRENDDTSPDLDSLLLKFNPNPIVAASTDFIIYPATQDPFENTTLRSRVFEGYFWHTRYLLFWTAELSSTADKRKTLDREKSQIAPAIFLISRRATINPFISCCFFCRSGVHYVDIPKSEFETVQKNGTLIEYLDNITSKSLLSQIQPTEITDHIVVKNIRQQLPTRKSFALIKKKTKSIYGWLETPKVSVEHDGVLLNLEREMPFCSANFGVAIITVKAGQKSEAEWSSNPPSGELFKLLDALTDDSAQEKADKGKYFSSWSSFHFEFHVSAFMNSEERRRLIGNDCSIIFFVEDEAVEFTPQFRSQVNNLGLVVRLRKDPFGNTSYALGAFSRNFSKAPQIYIPEAPIVSHNMLKKIILSNVVNGSKASTYTPPFFDLAAETASFQLQNVVQALERISK